MVAYDAVRRTWLIATLGADESSGGLLRQPLGRRAHLEPPTVAAARPEERYDKEWLTCDAWQRSPWRGTCYLSYLDGETVEIRTRRSTDGGRSWSAPVGVRAPGSAQPNGAFPVVRPDGMLLVCSARSPSRRKTGTPSWPHARPTAARRWAEVTVVAERFEEQIVGVRAPVLPSVDVDAAGRVYVAWGDCRFSVDCVANDIVVATSADGRRLDRRRNACASRAAPDLDWFVPGISVAPGTSGARAQLAVTAYAVTKAYGCRELRARSTRSRSRRPTAVVPGTPPAV